MFITFSSSYNKTLSKIFTKSYKPAAVNTVEDNNRAFAILKKTIQGIPDAIEETYKSFLISIENKFFLEKNSEIKDIKIWIDDNSLLELTSNLPKSTRNWQKGKLEYPDGKVKKIKFRIRGRNPWHFHIEKPSLRLKLKKEYPINLQRHINLTNPEDRTQISNFYSELIANEMGVLSHQNEMVRLFINNKYYGIYQQHTREDENFLRLRNKIPGPIYVGNNLKKKWSFEDFEIKGEDKILDFVQPMKDAIEVLNLSPSPENFDKLWKIFDSNKFANYVATLNILGGIHSDWKHNHAFYFDPGIGKVEPLTSDILGLGELMYPRGFKKLLLDDMPTFKTSINEKNNPLIDFILRDPYFYQKRNQILYQAIKTKLSTSNQIAKLKDLYKKIDNAVLSDNKKSFVLGAFSGWLRSSLSNSDYIKYKKNLFDWIKNRNKFLVNELEKIELSVNIYKHNKETLALIGVKGHSSAALNLSNKKVKIYSPKINKFKNHSANNLLLYPGLYEENNLNDLAVINRRYPSHTLLPKFNYYILSFSDITPIELSDFLVNKFSNYISKKSLSPKIHINNNEIIDFNLVNSDSFHPMFFEDDEINSIILGPGNLSISESIISNPGQKIIINPGTNIKLGPNVSIVSQGGLFFNGKKNDEIFISRLEKDKPWGVISAVSNKSNASIVSNSNIEGGSQDIINNIVYSGMVTFRGVENVTIKSSKISKNTLGDDTLHFVYSNGDIDNLLMSDCYGDCIDFDYSNFTISNSSIINAGNDGLDFMTSKATIKNTNIFKAGDKGISAGEASSLDVINSSISQTEIGIASKDKSKVNLVSSSLSENKTGLSLYKKNLRYGYSGSVNIGENVSMDANLIDAIVRDGGDLSNINNIPLKVINK